ncbi:hypothetical protein HMPREF2685_03380 [Streptococcus sp. HMSC074F05]|nr:hypothetical protein HMPREF2685_03380 [Streptococcus sp. HMSC074F05]
MSVPFPTISFFHIISENRWKIKYSKILSIGKCGCQRAQWLLTVESFQENLVSLLKKPLTGLQIGFA